MGYLYFAVKPDSLQMLEGTLIPEVPKGSIGVATGILGAVIMPHNLYLHSALVLSRKIDTTNHAAVKEANFYNLIESSIALFVSFLVNMIVVGVFAYGFNGSKSRVEPGVCPIDQNSTVINPCAPENIELLNAGCCLSYAFGSHPGEPSNEPNSALLYVWAIGLLAAGQSSTMTGTYAGQ